MKSRAFCNKRGCRHSKYHLSYAVILKWLIRILSPHKQMKISIWLSKHDSTVHAADICSLGYVVKSKLKEYISEWRVDGWTNEQHIIYWYPSRWFGGCVEYGSYFGGCTYSFWTVCIGDERYFQEACLNQQGGHSQHASGQSTLAWQHWIWQTDPYSAGNIQERGIFEQLANVTHPKI